MQYERVINPRVANVPPSGIRKFFDIVRQMPGAISLGVGEPDFVTPWPIRDAAIQAIQEGRTQDGVSARKGGGLSAHALPRRI